MFGLHTKIYLCISGQRWTTKANPCLQSVLFSVFQFQVTDRLQVVLRKKFPSTSTVCEKKKKKKKAWSFYWNDSRNGGSAQIFCVSSLCVSDVLTAFLFVTMKATQVSRASSHAIFFFKRCVKESVNRDLFFDLVCSLSLALSVCISLGLFLMIAKMNHQATN